MRKVAVSLFVIAVVVSTLMFFRGKAIAQSSGSDVLVVLSCAGPAPVSGFASFSSTGYSGPGGSLICTDTERANPKMITTSADVVGGWAISLTISGCGSAAQTCGFSGVAVPSHLNCETGTKPNCAVEFTIR